MGDSGPPPPVAVESQASVKSVSVSVRLLQSLGSAGAALAPRWEGGQGYAQTGRAAGKEVARAP